MSIVADGLKCQLQADYVNDTGVPGTNDPWVSDWVDLSHSGHDGSLSANFAETTASGWTCDTPNALQFKRADKTGVAIANGSDLATPFHSLEFWVKHIGTAVGYIYARSVNGDIWAHQGVVLQGGKLTYCVNDGYNDEHWDICDISALADGDQLGFSVDGHYVTAYRNGSTLGSHGFGLYSNNYSSDAVWLGRVPYDDYYWDGALEAFRWYDHALSGGDWAQNYAAGPGWTGAEVVPGAVLELHGGTAKDGTGPGTNSPLTTDWHDDSGNAHDGTLVGFSGESPWQGTGTFSDPYCCEFDGTNDCAVLPVVRAGDHSVCTHEAWARMASPPSGIMILTSETGATPSPYNVAEIWVFPGGYTKFLITQAGVGVNATYGGGVCDDAWHHIVGTSDGVYINLYVDGVLRAGPHAITGGAFVADYVGVGCEVSPFDGSGSSWWTGALAVARIYPFALTAEQVAQNYLAGPNWVPTAAATLVAQGAVATLAGEAALAPPTTLAAHGAVTTLVGDAVLTPSEGPLSATGTVLRLEGRAAISGVLRAFSAVLSLIGSASLKAVSNPLLAAAGTVARLGGRARLQPKLPLPPTDWEWGEVEIDPDALKSIVFRLETPDGVVGFIDPALLSNCSLVLNDAGWYESGQLDFFRDPAVDLGDLDPFTSLTVTYRGREIWAGRLDEPGIQWGATPGQRMLRFAGEAAALADDQTLRRIFVDSDLSRWKTEQGGLQGSGIDVRNDAQGITFSAQWGHTYQPNTEGVYWSEVARAYYEQFDGVLAPGEFIHGWRFVVGVTGTEGYESWLPSLTGRERMDEGAIDGCVQSGGFPGLLGPTVVTAWWPPEWVESVVPMFAGEGYPFSENDRRVRCLVVQWGHRNNQTAQKFNLVHQQGGGYPDVNDQPIPQGFRIVAASIYGTDLNWGAVTPEAVVTNLMSGYFPFDYDESSGVLLDQCAFVQPTDRLSAIGQVMATVGWLWGVKQHRGFGRARWTAATVPDDALYTLTTRHPQVTGQLMPSLLDCYNAVRVAYTGGDGINREVEVRGDSQALGTMRRATVIEAPTGATTDVLIFGTHEWVDIDTALASPHSAAYIGGVWLRDRLEPLLTGTFTAKGAMPVANGEERDCLLIEPGEFVQVMDAGRGISRRQEIVRVTLNPLTHEATAEVGVSSRLFDRWLAALAMKVRRR